MKFQPSTAEAQVAEKLHELHAPFPWHLLQWLAMRGRELTAGDFAAVTALLAREAQLVADIEALSENLRTRQDEK